MAYDQVGALEFSVIMHREGEGSSVYYVSWCIMVLFIQILARYVFVEPISGARCLAMPDKAESLPE